MSLNQRFLPWIMWSLGALFYFYAFFQRTAPSVMVPEMMRDFQADGTAVGGLSAVYFYAYMAVQVPTGIMADRWGPRRVLALAAAFCGIGSLLFAAADSLMVAYLGRFLIGAGAGFGFICTLKISIIWFPPHRFALLSGMTMMVGMAGGVAGQAPMAMAVSAAGWRGTMTAAGIAALGIAFAIWLIVRNHPSPAHDPSREKSSGPAETPPVMVHLAGAIRRPPTWIMIGYGFVCIVILLAFAGLWSVPYMMQTQGISRPEAAATASLVLIGWGLAAPVVGWLSDRLRLRKPFLIAGPLATLLTMSMLLYLPDLSPAAFNLLMFATGVALAGMVPSFAVVREHNHAGAGAAAMSFINMAITASGAVFQPLIGWLLDLNWDGRMEAGERIYSAAAYDGALWIFPACSLAALVLALMVRETHGLTLEERQARSAA